jgi:hypothetical protein
MNKPTLATITGTMLVPGVSKNNRLYTKTAISRAVARMQERLNGADGQAIVMRTHHGAGDDTSLVVGRLTNIQQEPDGSATYEAKLFNNNAGRDLAPLLATDEDGKSGLRTTSIYGYWVGPVEHVDHNGTKAETAEDLEIDAIDFTLSPGVAQSRIKSVTFESVSASSSHLNPILEDGEATVTMEPAVEDDKPDPVTETGLEVWEAKFSAGQRRRMAAAGQAMPGGRYPIASKSHLRDAIRAVGRGKGSHDEIRRHIIKRAKALGLSAMIPPSWSPGGARKENIMPETVEVTECNVTVGDPDDPMVQIIVAPECDPCLVKVAAKLCAKALKQMHGAEDDMDAMDDISGDDWMVVPKETVVTVNMGGKAHEMTLKPPTNKTTETKESAVAEDTKAATPAAPSLTEADMTKLATVVAAAVAEAMKGTAVDRFNAAVQPKTKNKKGKKTATSDNEAGPESVTKTSAKATETATVEAATPEQITAMLAEERKKTIAAVREQLIKENGVPARRGFRVSESDTDVTPTGNDVWDKRLDVWDQFFPAGWGIGQPVGVGK